MCQIEKKDTKVLWKWHQSTDLKKKLQAKLRICFFQWHRTSIIFSTMIWKPYDSHRNLAISPIFPQQNRELYVIFCSSKKYSFKMEIGARGTCQDYPWVLSKERSQSYTSQCSSLIHHLYFLCSLTGKKLKITKDAILHAMDCCNGVCAHKLSLWQWTDSF